MARTGVEIKLVDSLEFGNLAQRFRTERQLTVKGVQHDALEQIAECHVLVFGERLEHFQDAALHAHAGLDAFYFDLPGRSAHGSFRVAIWYQCTMVLSVGQVAHWRSWFHFRRHMIDSTQLFC